MLGRLRRLTGRGDGGGLSPEQESLLERHLARGRDYIGPLTRDVSRAEHGRWNAIFAGERFNPVSPWKTETGRALLETPEVAVSVVVSAVATGNPDLALALTRRKLPYRADDVSLLVALATHPAPRQRVVESGQTITMPPYQGLWELHDGLRVALAAAESLPPEQWTGAVRAALEDARSRVERDRTAGFDAERTKLLARLRKLLGGELDANAISTDDEFGKELRKAINERWSDAGELLTHLAQATSGPTPAKKWQARARELVAETRDGDELLRAIVTGALAASDGVRRRHGDWLVYEWLTDENAVLVRGAVWAAAAIGAGWAPQTLAELAEHAAKSPEPGYEPRDMKVANACIRQLGELGNDEAVGALARLKTRIRHKTMAKQVERALEQAATAAGLTKGELLERQVPRFGLDAEGRKEVRLGAATAIVERDTLSWLSGGKPVKSAPKAVKDEHAAELRALREEQREIKKALATERLRVESLFAEERTWSLEDWRRLYLDHPLTGAFARRLIWRFGDEAALPLDGSFVGADGSEVEPAGEVRLWHPLDARPEEVAQWRRLLLDRQLSQPFKQAFREVYLVAPAEVETGTYSNRFAAHILKYRQAYALVKTRGWSVTALGPYDNDGGRQWRDFEAHGLRAEFWMEHAAEDWDEQAMIANLASTDQVRFTPLGGGDPIPVAEVPPIVFSEAMRDVDLFVGVASIAADPEWIDRGDCYVAYWREHSFGELGTLAETRREILHELVPQLKIAERLELDDRYLWVRGDRRTYKIHLGSANVLMEPNDEYLCIVPARGRQAGPRVLLPFEDDARLSEIVSKAFLLAADRKITDRTILAQIER